MTSSTTSPRAADGRNMVATTLFCVSTFLAPLAVHSQPLSGDGYLFHQPRASFTVRGGYSRLSAGGDVIEHARSNLTLNRSNFDAFNVSGELGIQFSSRFSLQISSGYGQRASDSEERYWIDNDDKPIEQTTTVLRVPLMAGLRFDLTKPGRAVGKLAFIPSRITPYVAGGVGAMFYKFKQAGSFKDDNSVNILDTTLESTGNSFASYGAIGADITLTPTVAFTTDVRYESAKTKPAGYSFGDFDRLDLSGVTATIGLTFRY